MNTDPIRAGNQSPDSLIGNTIDEKYRIESILGAGGMGTVYRATRLMIGDAVAIKVLHPAEVSDLQAIERFRREAQAVARLKHPNVVTVHDFGVSNRSLVYFVMELVEGESLRSIIKRGPLTPSATGEIISQVCGALDEAHRRNIIHRDLKPDNIIVTTSSTGLRVKVLDFGIAKLLDLSVTADNLTQTGTVLGTPHYMSPEQCLGEELDGRSDIYSLGIVLYEMLSGVVPFNSPSLTALVLQHVTQPPPPLRGINISISAAIERVVMRALEKQPEARQPTADELDLELRDAIRGSVNTPATVIRQRTVNPEKTIAASSREGTGLAATVPMAMPNGVFPSRATVTPAGKPRRRFLPLVVGSVLILLCALGLVAWRLSIRGRDDRVIDTPPGKSPRNEGDAKSDLAMQAEDKIVKGEELSDSDVLGLSLPEIKRLRNAVFARHGRVFQTPELQNYFVGRPWYKPRNNYSDRDLTPADRANTRITTAAETRIVSSVSAPGGTESSVKITATASSTRAPFRDLNYRAENAVDGSMATAWVEGVKGPGIGEWIQLNFDHEVKLRRVFIAPGYFKSPQIWLKNNRLAVAGFHFSDGSSREFRLPDQMQEQRIEVGEVRTNWVRIEIKQVYIAQSDSEDTAISEIRFEWEP